MDKGDVVADFELPDETGASRRLSDLLENGRSSCSSIRRP
jgi:hypothetical protein